MLDRRSLARRPVSGLRPCQPGRRNRASGLRFGPAQAVQLRRLQGYAKKIASQPYKAPYRPPADLLRRDRLSTSVQKIHFRAEACPVAWRPRPIRWRFFILANYSGEPVTIYAVRRRQPPARFSTARTISIMAASGVDPRPLAELGFAGFRVMDGQNKPTDWLAFQGASYFRSSGQDAQYGASARGIAINTASADGGRISPLLAILAGGERPGRHHLCLAGRPQPHRRLQIRHREAWTAAVMNVHCDLFFRADISRLGVAPLTSMYWYGENQRDKASDWRPEIHDNDGLAHWNGRGERIWRPLINPPQVQTNSFIDEQSQRLRADAARPRCSTTIRTTAPSTTSGPASGSSPRAIGARARCSWWRFPPPTRSTTISWSIGGPMRRSSSGDSLAFDYRLYWQDNEPAFPKTIARVVATRHRPWQRGGFKHRRRQPAPLCDRFPGRALSAMAPRFDITPVLDTSSGKIDGAFVIKVVGTDRWRADIRSVARSNGRRQKAHRPALFSAPGQQDPQ